MNQVEKSILHNLADFILRCDAEGFKRRLLLADGGNTPSYINQLLDVWVNFNSAKVSLYPPKTDVGNLFNYRRFTLLHLALILPPEVLTITTDVMIALLEAGADPETKNSQGFTALMYAALVREESEVIELLLKYNAKLETKMQKGRRALHIAATDGNATALKTLLQAGADVDATTDEGKTAIMSAATQGHTECVRVLIQHGSDVNRVAEQGFNALLGAVIEDREDIVELLAKAGADLDCNNNSRFPVGSCLGICAAKGNTEITKLLLRYGANPSCETPRGLPFALAAHSGHRELAQLLLKAHQRRQQGLPSLEDEDEDDVEVKKVAAAAASSAAAAAGASSTVDTSVNSTKPEASAVSAAVLPKCAGCGSTERKDGSGKRLKVCSGCGDGSTARYCSAECQKQHWKEHKKVCRKDKGCK